MCLRGSKYHPIVILNENASVECSYEHNPIVRLLRISTKYERCCSADRVTPASSLGGECFFLGARSGPELQRAPVNALSSTDGLGPWSFVVMPIS